MTGKSHTFPHIALYGAGGVAVGAAGGRLTESGIRRRSFLRLLAGGGLLTLALKNARFVQAIYADVIREFNALTEDLKQAGYHVTATSDSTEFEKLLRDASKNRSPAAKTIVIINAHGNVDDNGAYVEGKPNLYVSTLADLTENSRRLSCSIKFL